MIAITLIGKNFANQKINLVECTEKTYMGDLAVHISKCLQLSYVKLSFSAEFKLFHFQVIRNQVNKKGKEAFLITLGGKIHLTCKISNFIPLHKFQIKSSLFKKCLLSTRKTNKGKFIHQAILKKRGVNLDGRRLFLFSNEIFPDDLKNILEGDILIVGECNSNQINVKTGKEEIN
jgi:hypothetical protein